MFKYLSVLVFVVFVSGCSSTWSGIKDDTSYNWRATKRAIHDVTSD